MAASSSLLLVAAGLAYRAAAKTEAHGLILQDPFELTLILRFAGLLAVIMLLAKLFSGGEGGLLTLGGLSGLLDVDPITLSMARMANTGLAQSLAVSTILVAVATNCLAKSFLAVIFGGWRLGLKLSGVALLAFGAGAAAYFG